MTDEERIEHAKAQNWNEQLRVLDGIMGVRLAGAHGVPQVDERLAKHAATFVQLGVALDDVSRESALGLLRSLTKDRSGR